MLDFKQTNRQLVKGNELLNVLYNYIIQSWGSNSVDKSKQTRLRGSVVLTKHQNREQQNTETSGLQTIVQNIHHSSTSPTLNNISSVRRNVAWSDDTWPDVQMIYNQAVV